MTKTMSMPIVIVENVDDPSEMEETFTIFDTKTEETRETSGKEDIIKEELEEESATTEDKSKVELLLERKELDESKEKESTKATAAAQVVKEEAKSLSEYNKSDASIADSSLKVVENAPSSVTKEVSKSVTTISTETISTKDVKHEGTEEGSDNNHDHQTGQESNYLEEKSVSSEDKSNVEKKYKEKESTEATTAVKIEVVKEEGKSLSKDQESDTGAADDTGAVESNSLKVVENVPSTIVTKEVSKPVTTISTSTTNSNSTATTTTTTSTISTSGLKHIANKGNHHHYNHNHHHPHHQNNYFNWQQAAAAAASHLNLSSLLPHLQHQHLQNQHPHHLQHLNHLNPQQSGLLQHQHHLQHSLQHQQHGNLQMQQPFPINGHHASHNHNNTNGRTQHLQHQPQYQSQQQHQFQNGNKGQQQQHNIPQPPPPPPPMPYGYFTSSVEPDGSIAPWALESCGGPSETLPLPPLPTAIIPLPLDPNFLPTVLSCTPPNTQSTSGYSTAGHSRSSSPMSGGVTVGHLGGGQEPIPGGSGLLPIPNNAANGFGLGINPNFVFAAASNELSMFPQPAALASHQYVVYFHINPGVSVSFSVGGQSQIVKGPMTVPLVSTNSSPPIPLPMQVPPGHVVQQIVDENGTLRHVIVSHQPPLMPIPSYGPSSQSQQFYPTGPGGYPNAHFQPMQAVPCGLPSPHQQGPQQGGGIPGYPNTIPVHAQKDERTMRQFVKIRRKFEQKQGTTPASYNNNQPYTNNQASTLQTGYAVNNSSNGVGSSGGGGSGIRKSVANGAPKSPANGVGLEEDGSVGSTGSVTSTGTQDEEEENRSHALSEMLSSIPGPTVTEVTARSAYVVWSHPDRISESGENKFPDFCDVSDTDFRYEVFISEKNRDARFRSIFVGSALSCRVKDLKPGSLYAITYCSMLGDVKGNTSTPASFTTLAAEPDQPASPRPVSRSRSSIQFKWVPPLSDNGSKITNFILEYDEGKGGSNFVEVFRGRTKQCTVSKLQPAYSYQFRLAATNQIGQSRYSSVISVMTAGSPPSQPCPPTVVEAGVKYLRLEWKARDTDDEYCLQMEDPGTGHGFLAVYNGSAPNTLCIGLKRNTQYKFRLRAQNEEGHSKWSDEVVLATQPDRPGPPHKPTLKGRVHAYGFKVRWEPPSDNGGVPITAYALEIDQGNGGYEEIYRGVETEFNVDRLSPGQSYALHVIAIGAGGGSDPSENCVITTEPVTPGKCHIPRIIGKPKSNSVHLKWSPPDWDGGSPVNMYEVGCTTPDNQTQEAYRGKETECSVNRLLPGRAYLFQIRAFNRIGAGPWSPPLEVISGAGAPDTPSGPKLNTKTSHIVLVSWTEPLNNGSAVTEYRLQMATPTPSISQEEEEGEEKKEEIKNEVSTFTQVYLGPAPSCEVKGLTPASLYLFRVQAANGAGSSDWSAVTTHQMPASSPNGVVGLEASSASNSISISWKVPADNGSAITHYNVMIGETVLVAHSNCHVLDNLMPDTHYKIRVQAVNTVGPGAFSSTIKVATKPLPPLAPKLECVSVAHFWMKLKWNENSGKNVEYLVQMINPYKDEFEVVYRGTSSNCKVTRLEEDTEYQFRICALNGAGQGPFSDLFTFATSKSPPTQVKGCKSELIKDLRVHRFEWFEVTCGEPVEYQFQVAQKRKDPEFKTMYRGSEKKVELSHEDKLEEGIDYVCRVCAIRMCGDGSQLVGPYSNIANFQVPVSLREDLSKAHSSSSKSLSPVTNTYFTTLEEKMSSISYESRVGILAVFALIILAFVISLITHHVVS